MSVAITEPATLAELEAAPTTSVHCPYCGARPGVYCTVRGTGRLVATTFQHEDRYWAADVYRRAFKAGYAAALTDMETTITELRSKQ